MSSSSKLKYIIIYNATIHSKELSYFMCIYWIKTLFILDMFRHPTWPSLVWNRIKLQRYRYRSLSSLKYKAGNGLPPAVVHRKYQSAFYSQNVTLFHSIRPKVPKLTPVSKGGLSCVDFLESHNGWTAPYQNILYRFSPNSENKFGNYTWKSTYAPN